MEGPIQFSNMSDLSSEDQRSLFRFGRGPRIPVPYNTVHEAFEAIVDTYPTVVAAVHNSKQITYQQLDCAANRLAHHLINSGLRPKQRVCLVVQRSLEMLIGILAILKTGCQYVPIDGGVASEKNLEHIIKDTKARFILCLPTYWNKVTKFAHQDTVVLELGRDTGAFYSSQRPKVQVSPNDGVYAMYTSGSTGVPKGVDVKHSTMTNALLLEPGRLRITVGSNVAQVLSISFAMGSWEMLGSLMNGGTLHLRGSDWNLTLEKVDTLICTPSILSKYQQQHFPNIKTIVVAGEPCPQALADEWAQERHFYNLLGSTEVFLFSAHKHVPGEPLSIGRPLPNTTCYILDDAGERPVPLGQKGTLWVGGAGISRGYIDLPITTAEKYRPDRFVNDGSSMFNFGNIVCWKPDGSLDSFGRMDDQVKIKGFRVELDGVTAVLEKFDGITKAASLIINEILHGFYTSPNPINDQELRIFTSKVLPYYSVPERWIQVEIIPLNTNGKVDKVELKTIALRFHETTTIVNPEKPSHQRKDSAFDDLQIRKEVVLPLPVRTEKLSMPSTELTYNVDLEKGLQVVISKDPDSTSLPGSAELVNGPAMLPGTKGPPAHAWLRHRALITYRWLLLLVVFANVGVACWILYRHIKHDAFPLSSVGTATASNLCAAILIRSEPVINLLFTVFSSVPTWIPLRIRRTCAYVYHLGGIHSGCAVAAVIWFIIFTIGISLELAKDAETRAISLATVTLSYLIAALLIVMACLSFPTFRARYHNLWENTHRFGGWSVLILYWILVGISTEELSSRLSTTSDAFLHNPSIWLLTAATLAIVFPWLFLRRVPVRSEVLSSHAIRLHFDYTKLSPGQGIRLAESPLRDWHGFATVKNVKKNQSNSIENEFSVIVSRAGDFTGRVIDTKPTHIWKRGIPACGVLRIATLFKSVVLVATGSGIGPCLSIFPYQNVIMRILWTAPNHEASFGKSILEDVRRRDPRAVIHNTRTQGKPDMSLMAYRLYKESGAEAVLVISNRRLTNQIVYDLEKRGIPAYGAIFDS